MKGAKPIMTLEINLAAGEINRSIWPTLTECEVALSQYLNHAKGNEETIQQNIVLKIQQILDDNGIGTSIQLIANAQNADEIVQNGSVYVNIGSHTLVWTGTKLIFLWKSKK